MASACLRSARWQKRQDYQHGGSQHQKHTWCYTSVSQEKSKVICSIQWHLKMLDVLLDPYSFINIFIISMYQTFCHQTLSGLTASLPLSEVSLLLKKFFTAEWRVWGQRVLNVVQPVKPRFFFTSSSIKQFLQVAPSFQSKSLSLFEYI